ncbi:sulfotransferase [Vibrio sp. 10N.222.51.C5]|uniref:sulfotransferase n=1 Tax=Vibrio sp. 10N.222.51.C5 TaxID=3229623 RepID=UPI003551F82D
MSENNMKFRVFQIGFNKCATVSVCHFFRDNGYKAVHWDKNKLAQTMKYNAEQGKNVITGYENFDVFTDMEGYSVEGDSYIYAYMDYFKEMYEDNPNSKFILNTRSRSKWILSRIKHGRGSYVRDLCRINECTEEELIMKWNVEWYEHHLNVINYFKDKPEHLLLFDIENDSPQVIVDFLKDNMSLDVEMWAHHHKSSEKYK